MSLPGWLVVTTYRAECRGCAFTCTAHDDPLRARACAVVHYLNCPTHTPKSHDEAIAELYGELAEALGTNFAKFTTDHPHSTGTEASST